MHYTLEQNNNGLSSISELQFEQATPERSHALTLSISPLEIVARELYHLCHEKHPDSEPLIFMGPKYGRHRHHQKELLDKLVERNQESAFHHITAWERITAPEYAYGIAGTPLAGTLRKADLRREASLYNRNTTTGPTSGWYRYTFFSGWTAYAVMLLPDEDCDAKTLIAVPRGRQDEWLAFLQALDTLHREMLERDRKGVIDIIGAPDDVISAIKRTTFSDVILPEKILREVKAHRCIFEPTILKRYALRTIPCKRFVLLGGPPGTGKTTLLKAEAAQHAKNGGYVIYVFAAKKANTSWELFSAALDSAAESKLPTLIIVEDFENFVSQVEDMQQVLNTLDGVATPNNPSGTLILASTNAPEKIDPRIKDRPGRVDAIIEIGPITQEELVLRFFERFLGTDYQEEEHAPIASEFLGQTGSHIREVCLRGTLLALNAGREAIEQKDLLAAHQAILHGRAIAAEPERFAPTPAKKPAELGFNRNKK